MARHTTHVSITIGNEAVTLRRSGSSTRIVANILGSEKDAKGEATRIWLDRRVHRPGEEFDGWQASGAVVTILERQEPAQ